MVKVATVSMEVAFDKQKNLEKYEQFIEDAAKENVKLIVFPEQSVQGYLKNLFSIDYDNVAYQHREAELVPEGETTHKLIQLAKQYDMYIVFGITERDSTRYDILYNSAVLVGPEGFVGTYRKIHQPGDEVHVYYPGDEFKVFDTKLGKIGLLICYDKMFPETTRELALKGAEILIMPTAWPLTAVGSEPNTDQMGMYFNLLDQTRAFENQCWFISSDIVGIHGDHDFYGHSQIVSPNGNILATCGYEEKMVIEDINVQESIVQTRSVGLMSLNLLKERHPATYTALKE